MAQPVWKRKGKQCGHRFKYIRPYGKCNIICVDIFRLSVDLRQCDIKIIQFDFCGTLGYHIITTSITIACSSGRVGWCGGVFWVGLVRCIFSGGMCFVLFMFLNKAFITAWPAQASSALSNVDWVG